VPKTSGATKKRRRDQLAGDLGEIFSLGEATAAGIPRAQFYARRDRGELISLGGGFYRRADAPPADLDLIEIAERIPMGTLCLESALAHHGLLDAIPAGIDIALPRGAHRPKLRAPARLHQFDPSTFELGRSHFDVGARRPLGIYSAERSLIDFIRLRHHQGSDQAWEALRKWLAKPGRSPGALLQTAAHFKGAEAPLRTALEILL
jgi:hypothetical protein